MSAIARRQAINIRLGGGVFLSVPTPAANSMSTSYELHPIHTNRLNFLLL
jgi:hypothetical protein